MINFNTSVSDGGATVIAATGRLDMMAAPQLKALVQGAVAEARMPVVVDLTAVQFIDSTGLGALISGQHLAPGDLLLIFSDGVVEASGPAGVAFGSEGLTALLSADRGRSAADSVAHVLGRLADFRDAGIQDDDVTVVGLLVLATVRPGVTQ